MSHDSDQEERIFSNALEIAKAADRARFLEAACGDDLELRRRVEALLRATERQDLLFPPEPGGSAGGRAR